jgi:AraC-like DNA-binding protein
MATPRRPKLVQTRPTGHGRARGLVSSRKSGGRIESHTYAPAEDLAGVVAAYWTGRWDLRGQTPHVTELLGDPCVHFVCEAGGPHAGARVVGVWTRLWKRTLEGVGRVRGVKLRAGAARAFLAAPAAAFRNRIVPLDAAFGRGAARLRRAVLEPAEDHEGFAAFEAWLRAHRRPDDDGQISLSVALVERIARDADITSVERLAAIAGLHPRALQRLFREHVGASPKWVIRRNRLQEVALRLERGEATSLAMLAAELGYTDQAHLARDFKAVVGKSPSAFAAFVHR